MALAGFWAAALGSDVDEDSTPARAWVEPAGWGGPTLWFQRVPERKAAKNRQHFDLCAVDDLSAEIRRLCSLGATVIGDSPTMAILQDPEGNVFCLEP